MGGSFQLPFDKNMCWNVVGRWWQDCLLGRLLRNVVWDCDFDVWDKSGVFLREVDSDGAMLQSLSVYVLFDILANGSEIGVRIG